MVNLYFFLKKERQYKDGTCPVFMQLSYHGNRIRRPVHGVTAKPGQWSSEKGRIRRSDANPNFEAFNSRLDEIQSNVNELNRNAFIHKIRLTDNYILDRVNNANKIAVDKKEFFAVFEEYLETISSNSAKRTITGKTTVLNFLKGFQEAKKMSLSLSSFDNDLFEQLRRYAYEEKKIGANYFAKIIATLKTLLQWSFDRGLTQNIAFKKYSAPEKETEVIYLTIDELKLLYHHNFTSPRLAQVRDVYCFCCFTGLRISDAQSLRAPHIQDNQIIKVIEKTREINAIPLNFFAKEILAKYHDTVRAPLPKISSQKFNVYIKECCEKVGIKTPTTIVRFSGGVRVETTLPKFELITSHTARKTFATNSLILGMKEIVIRNMTGHKKESSFKRYIKIADSVKRIEMDNTWNSVTL